VRAVAVTPLPGAPTVIEGIIDVRGTITPVFNLRRRFGFRNRPVEPADHFVLVRTAARSAALHVDRPDDLVDVDETSVSDPQRQPDVPHIASVASIAGVATLSDGLVLIHDVETFLSAAEADGLDSALNARTATASANS
jgi:purine-binding chemotaxis protein CheW